MSESNRDYRIVLCTAGSEAQAAEIARALVERRLAACVNVVPTICSTYRWQGKVVEEGESLLIIKTDAAHFEALRVAAHQLKGSGGGYGYPSLTERAGVLEQHAKRQSVDDCLASFEELKELCSRVVVNAEG